MLFDGTLDSVSAELSKNTAYYKGFALKQARPCSCGLGLFQFYSLGLESVKFAEIFWICQPRLNTFGDLRSYVGYIKQFFVGRFN